MSDLISRQNTIDAISTWDKFGVNVRGEVVRWYEGLEPYVKLRDVVWAIEKLPSAERTGHWTIRTTITSNGNTYYSYECSECGDHHGTMWNYCPHCGARMMEGEEE